MFKLNVLTPERKAVFDIDVTEVSVPAYSGEMTFLPGHAPFITTLGTGILKYKVKGQEKAFKAVLSWGYCEVVPQGVNVLAEFIQTPEEVVVENSQIKVSLKDGAELNRENKCVWGLTRALIASELKGLEDGFTYTIRLVGLSCKAALVGEKVVFTLGYSHKIEVPLDKNISVEIDKNGQLMTLKSSDKFALGNYCSHIRSLRPPEPYKGTGIFVNDEKILRKAGKSK